MSNINIIGGEQVSIGVSNQTASGISVVNQPTTSVSVAGMVSGGDKNYVHDQGSPSATWEVQHNLNKKPAVTIVDSIGMVVHGDIEYVDNNNVTITFESGSFSGKAFFN